MPTNDSSVITEFQTSDGYTNPTPLNGTTPNQTPPTATPGETITLSDQWSVSLDQNTSTGDIILKDTLNGVTNSSQVVVNNGGTYGGGIITWDLGTFTGVGSKNGTVSFGDYTATVTIPPDYAPGAFSSLATITPAPDDTNSADDTSTTEIQVVCFCSGTLITTRFGIVPLEKLLIGDHVITVGGKEKPIRWLGHRTIDCRNHPRPDEVMPIRIAAQAFGEDRPARDLFVSPGHSICVDVLGEVLIPASALVNGTTIQQIEVDEITYWHVELDSHDIIFADNLPAESYLDMGNRSFFAEARVVDLDAGPDVDPASRTHADFCRPFHGGGPLVDVVRAQLQKRAEAAGWSLTSALDLHILRSTGNGLIPRSVARSRGSPCQPTPKTCGAYRPRRVLTTP